MPHHPALEEVLEDACNYEWMRLHVCGFFLGDFADAENGIGEVSSPSFVLLSGPSESEQGSYSFQQSSINIIQARDDELNNLNGKFPLGSVNYYEDERVFITIALSEKIYSNLIILLCHNIENLSVKVAITKWKDEACKCLPLIKYQITYNENGEREI
jgi:hypothetical protein